MEITRMDTTDRPWTNLQLSFLQYALDNVAYTRSRSTVRRAKIWLDKLKHHPIHSFFLSMLYATQKDTINCFDLIHTH